MRVHTRVNMIGWTLPMLPVLSVSTYSYLSVYTTYMYMLYKFITIEYIVAESEDRQLKHY